MLLGWHKVHATKRLGIDEHATFRVGAWAFVTYIWWRKYIPRHIIHRASTGHLIEPGRFVSLMVSGTAPLHLNFGWVQIVIILIIIVLKLFIGLALKHLRFHKFVRFHDLFYVPLRGFIILLINPFSFYNSIRAILPTIHLKHRINLWFHHAKSTKMLFTCNRLLFSTHPWLTLWKKVGCCDSGPPNNDILFIKIWRFICSYWWLLRLS